MNELVLDLRDRRPVWAMPDWVADEVRSALPGDWIVHVVQEASDGSGDGAARVSPEVLDAVRDARVYLGYGIAPEILTAGSRLEWVHSAAAGVGTSLTAELRASGVRFTNSAGIHGPPIAETVVAMILHFARGLDSAVEARTRREWSAEPWYAGDPPPREVGHGTVGIVGLGGVGGEVARRVLALGARVLGLRRGPFGGPPLAASPGGARKRVDRGPRWVEPLPEDTEGLEVVTGEAGLIRVLERSDYVVVTAPHTPETEGLISRSALARVKPGAVLINVSRGALVDEEALVDALRGGRLRGAALDVARVEPLPPDHPLWELPNVLITPHVSAVSTGFWRREADLITGNIRRFVEGRPLLNQVDVDAGY